jgi:hypothetical protein
MARKRPSEAAAETPVSSETPPQTETKDTPQGTKRKFDWTNVTDFGGFKLRPKAPKKRKSGSVRSAKKPTTAVVSEADILQDDPFDAGLAPTYLQVTPMIPWENTMRYKRFTSMSSLHVEVQCADATCVVEDAEFETGDTVFVKGDASQTSSGDAPVEDWVAKVLEVRAGDAVCTTQLPASGIRADQNSSITSTFASIGFIVQKTFPLVANPTTAPTS